ncbi:uncharacterized protein LOC132191035 [Corylus avellana]|uniref:uncharacterized protein LOC132191035 n=1 Tax=Corylus avellana TaxID=13451 RepID=UPI00286D1BE0|nr:uncharacterized protein LOC132191035 [Corylus avellana]
MTDQRFHDLISKFPLLKNLHVKRCRILKAIKISSNRLERFSFVECLFMRPLVKVEIDAPNLIFFEYSGGVEPGAMLLPVFEDRLPLPYEVEPLPYKVEQLQLDLQSPSSSSTYADILHNLLQICRPLTIIALKDHELIIKYFYETLLSKEDLSCCNSKDVKCWKHYLKDVKIRSRIEGIEAETPLCLKTLCGAYVKGNQKICLILKWSHGYNV